MNFLKKTLSVSVLTVLSITAQVNSPAYGAACPITPPKGNPTQEQLTGLLQQACAYYRKKLEKNNCKPYDKRTVCVEYRNSISDCKCPKENKI